MFVYRLLSLLAASLFVMACSTPSSSEKENAQPAALRIVSLAPSFTEAIALAGKLDQVVGVDVTSTYPAAADSLPKLGHVRNLKAEAILAVNPDVVVAFSADLDPALTSQLQSAGVRLWLFEKKYSPEDLFSWVKTLGDSLQVPGLAAQVEQEVNARLAEVTPLDPKPRVLFIYARGAGALSVAGTGTQAEAMVRLAGGEYAVTEFNNFKPLTPEALVAANPDVILLFDDGLQSLGGMEGLLKTPGIAQTRAGKERAIVTMEGNLLLGFGPRMGLAAKMLNEKLRNPGA
jgi:iron complex transport system substrate-binding protein